MKRNIAIVAIALVAATAYADKASREFFKNELAPAVKAAETKFKSACGCALKINVATLKEEKEMRTSKYVCGSITDEAEKYCTDAESKAAMCKMKTLDLVKGAETKFTFGGGKGTATTDGQSYVHWDMITREIDK
jgi:hypothetical protein